MYFQNGIQMSKKDGEEQVTLMKTYLVPTHRLQGNFKSGNVDACQLGLPDLTITKIHDKHGKSTSNIILEGIAFGEEVMVKASFTPDFPEADNSLQIESRIYEEVVPLLSVHTPNVIPFLGKPECKPNFISTSFKSLTTSGSIPRNILKTFAAQMTGKHIIDEFDLDELQLVITKKAQGETLHEWLTSEKLSEATNFLEDVLFQLAYTLVIFEDFGLMHHDLHLGNVFVKELPSLLHLSVNVGEGKTMVRNVRYFVQIYDFDQSAKVETKFNSVAMHNTLLENDFCARFGQCNEFHKNVDWFTILYFIYHSMPHPLIRNLVNKDLLRNKNLAFPGRPCTKSSRGGGCTRIDLTKKGLITSPYDYLCEYHECCLSKTCAPQFSRPLEMREE
jgi:hypothetical protein